GMSNPTAKLEIAASGAANPDTNGLYVHNTKNEAGQDAILSARVGGSSGGDPFVSLDVGGESGWAIGVDNSDNNKLKFDSVWNSIGNATKMTIHNNGDVQFSGNLILENETYILP